MVNIDNKLAEIKEMVDRGDYFTINRARQYGKTTTLKALGRYLEADYFVLSLDFQKLSHQDFETEKLFVEALSREILKKPYIRENTSSEIIHGLEHFRDGAAPVVRLADLFSLLSEWCRLSAKPVVFIVDEVDSATNNQVFLDFLAQMRGYYIDRDEIPFFRSVILSGVYDVKNLKRKFVTEDSHKTNSPWNIAADFHVDLSFGTSDIAGMLESYEQNHHTGMDTQYIARLIYDYTSGYPFLVSSICKLVDERIVRRTSADGARAWIREDVLNAVRILLSEQNTLFESLINKLEDYPELESTLRDLCGWYTIH